MESKGLALPLFDCVQYAEATSSKTFTFKIGGSSGTTVSTVNIIYTDASKSTLSEIVKT